MTALAPDPRAALAPAYFWMRRLQSLSGLWFGVYLFVHLVVNATVAQRGGVFQEQVNKLEGLPLLIAVEITFIYIPILFHAIYGLWIAAQAKPNARQYAYGANWRYVLQRASGVIILGFLAFHILALRFNMLGFNLGFDPRNEIFTLWRHMLANWTVLYLIYPLGVLASCYHTANGLWTALITWA